MRFGRAVLVLSSLAGCASGGWVGGIHARLRYRPEEHSLWVERVSPEGPAARAGLRDGDRVVAIDGLAVDALPEYEVSSRLRGEVGTAVRLRIRRASDERDVSVTRAPYDAPAR